MADLFEVSPALRVLDSTDQQVYRELEGCLDARYAGASLMREGFGRCPGADNLESDVRAINVLVKNEQDASVLLSNARVMPFPVQFINDVVWGGNNMDLLHAKNAAIKVRSLCTHLLSLTECCEASNTVLNIVVGWLRALHC